MDLFSGLGVDLRSLAIYAVNFGIVVWIVKKYFSGPIIDTLNTRSELISRNIEEAEKLKKLLENQTEQMEKDLEQNKKKYEVEMIAFRKNLKEEEEKMSAEIQETKEKMLASIEKELNEKDQRFFEETKEKLTTLVQQTVKQIIGEEVSKEVVDSSTKKAWEDYEK